MSSMSPPPRAASRPPPADEGPPDFGSGPPVISAPRPPQADGPPSGHIERRRPGRTNDANPELLPLLRLQLSPRQAGIAGSEDWPTEEEDTADDDDQLRAARGILLGVLIAAIFWVSVGAILLL